MNVVLKHSDIKAVFATGQKAAQLYRKFCQPKTGMEIITLPSTSPANCAVSYEKLFEEYAVILKFLKD